MNDKPMTAPYQLLAVQHSPRLSLDSFAARVGLHPELIRRLVALGLIPATTDGAGRLWFVPTDVAVVARIRRLRADLSLNYAALGLVMDLLDRIRQLENATASAPRRRPTWT
jgi:DNA-binding transcriptional MerR regulator